MKASRELAGRQTFKSPNHFPDGTKTYQNRVTISSLVDDTKSSRRA